MQAIPTIFDGLNVNLGIQFDALLMSVTQLELKDNISA